MRFLSDIESESSVLQIGPPLKPPVLYTILVEDKEFQGPAAGISDTGLIHVYNLLIIICIIQLVNF